VKRIAFVETIRKRRNVQNRSSDCRNEPLLFRRVERTLLIERRDRGRETGKRSGFRERHRAGDRCEHRGEK
jgi:hypothetical protein